MEHCWIALFLAMCQTVMATEYCSVKLYGIPVTKRCSDYCCWSGGSKICCDSCERSVAYSGTCYEANFYLQKVVIPAVTFVGIMVALMILVRCFCRKTERGWVVQRRPAQVHATTVTVSTVSRAADNQPGYLSQPGYSTQPAGNAYPPGFQAYPVKPPPYSAQSAAPPAYGQPMAPPYDPSMNYPPPGVAYPPPPNYQ